MESSRIDRNQTELRESKERELNQAESIGITLNQKYYKLFTALCKYAKYNKCRNNVCSYTLGCNLSWSQMLSNFTNITYLLKKVNLKFQLTDKVVYKTTSLFGNVSANPTALVGLNLTGTQVVYECIAKMQQEPCLIFL